MEAALGVEALADAVLHPLADDEELALEGRGDHPAPPDVDLAQHRGRAAGEPPELPGIDRHVAPAEDPLALGLGDLGEHPLAGGARGRVGWEEDLAHAVAAAWRHLEAQAQALALEEAVRQLEENAGAVTGARVGTACRPVRQPLQDVETLLDDGARFLPSEVGHEAEPAGVVLHRWLVEAVPRGEGHLSLELLYRPTDRSAAERQVMKTKGGVRRTSNAPVHVQTDSGSEVHQPAYCPLGPTPQPRRVLRGV